MSAHPQEFNPRQVMNRWISQRYDQKRRYYHQLVLKAAKDRSRLEAVCVILETAKNIDKTIKLIRESKTNEEAIQKLMKEFNFSEFQASCIIQIRLSNLPKMNIDETKAERDKALHDYKHYRKLLSSDSAIKEAIREELEEGLRKYGQDRRAVIKNGFSSSADVESETKEIFYTNEYFLSFSDYAEAKSSKVQLSRDMKHITVQNSSMTLSVTQNGMVKLLDGNSFTKTTDGIGFNQVGFSDVASIINLTSKSKKILLFTKKGNGKIMDIDEITSIRSKKAKISNLSQGDSIIKVIEIPQDNKEYLVAVIAESGKVYFCPIQLFPELKRLSTGNNITKTKETFVDCYLVERSDHYMLYCEYGQVKVVNASSLQFGKRIPPSVKMQGRYVMGVVGLKEGKKIQVLSPKEKTKHIVKFTKMVNLISEKGTTIKFRFGTTIGDTTKVFKYGRNEYYTVKELD